MSITLSPSIGYNADGSEYVNYDNARIQDSQYSEAVGSGHFSNDLPDSDDDYYWDQNTESYRHKYADLDPEELERRLEGDSDPDFFDEVDELPAEDVDYLLDIAGGAEQYQQITAWAYNNLSEADIDDFDRIMDSNDINESEAAIRWLVEQYELNGGSQYYYDTTDTEDSDEDESYDSDDQNLANEIAEAYPDIDEAISWATANLDPSVIDEYNEALDGFDLQAKADAIQWLMDIYHNNY